jgi:small conductance mechanosensitive channel
MIIKSYFENFTPQILAWGLRFATGVVILVGGWIVAGWVSRAVGRLLMRSEKIDPTVRTFTASFVRYSILIVTILAVLARIGVQTASLVALLGAAGLAVGLALQGTLSDVAAGVILLVVRPFRVGDVVQLAGLEGTVRSVALFTTEIATPDNRKVIIPNSKVWGQPIINLTAHGSRRVDVAVLIDRPEDVPAATVILKDLIAKNGKILSVPESAVLVESLSDGTQLAAHAWCGSADHAELKASLLSGINDSFAAAGISRVRRSAAARIDLP